MAESLQQVFAMGAAALEANDFAAAEQLFRRIIEADARAHPAWNALSVVAVRTGFPDVAAEHAKRALELDRRNPVYLNSLGVAYGELGGFADAEQAFRRALKSKPVYAEAHYNLGNVLHKRGDIDGALQALQRAYAMDPGFSGLRAMLSLLYRKHGRSDRALTVLREAPAGGEVDDKLVPAIAECLADVEGTTAVSAWLRGLVERHPDWPRAHFTLALAALAQGNWREGWRQYLWRTNILPERSGGQPPALLPARCDGKHVRVRAEQGLGDTLFFLRFAQELRARGAAVSLALPPRLAAVVAGAGYPATQEGLAGPGDFDFDISCGDLPGRLDSVATPPAFPLTADAVRAAHYRRRLATLGPAPYLGLTWRAGTDVLRGQEFGRDRAVLSKEVPLAELGQALRGWRGTLVSVQRGPLAGETAAVAAAAGAPVHDLSALNDDLAEVLALLSVVEEYVCVSNTNVHLLAGIGRTARVLVPYPAEWRWMRRDGPSPWFPGFAVYREPQSRGWDQPLLALRKDLAL